MKGNNRNLANRKSFLETCLERVRPKFTKFFQEAIKKTPKQDVLDTLALLIVGELMMGKDTDIAAARAYFSILLENEHLPIGHQLSHNELMLLRDLLMDYFKGSDSINDKGSEVLTLIERKFLRAEFAQARLLLQIFEADDETAQNNERNLFYEEMITRLSMHNAMGANIHASVLEKIQKGNFTDADWMAYTKELSQDRGLHLCFYIKHQKDLETWKHVFKDLPPRVSETLMDYVPTARWKSAHYFEDEAVESLIQKHLTFEMLRRHVQVKLKMCYFILLASGKTHEEWFIFAFTRWSKKFFDVDPQNVLPFLHKSAVMDNLSLQEVLDIVIDRFYSPSLNKIAITKENSLQAWRNASIKLAKLPLKNVPNGYYNFGDFMLDEILPFEHENPLFVFKLYLIM